MKSYTIHSTDESAVINILHCSKNFSNKKICHW